MKSTTEDDVGISSDRVEEIPEIGLQEIVNAWTRQDGAAAVKVPESYPVADVVDITPLSVVVSEFRTALP